MTGTNDNRPDFQQMIKDSSRREWNFVLVYKLDRFSRNKYEMAMHKKSLKDNGVKLLSATEYIPDTPEAIIFESMLEGYAEYYSAELSQKVRRGMKETRRKGLYQGGSILYGYKVENRKLVIDDDRAAVVRYIYEQYSIGGYVREMIETLTAKGILYKGKPIATNTVYGILSNEKYSGVYKHGDEIIENMYPQIIPTELYEKVRAIVEKNKRGKRSVQTEYLLRNKMVCGYCGKPISAETGTARNGETRHYYKCIGIKKYRNGCEKTPMRKEILEEFILNAIIQELGKPKTMKNMIAYLLNLQDKIIAVNPSLNMVIREKNKVDKALENLLTAIEQGITSNTTNKRLHELESQQEDLERQILIEKSKVSIKLSENAIRDYYEEALKREAKMLITVLVKQIILYNDKIEIKLNSPLRNGPDESQGFSFYNETVKIAYYMYNKPELGKREIALQMSI